MVTAWVFTGLIILLALQRGIELRLSSRNEAIIRSKGGREHAAWQLAAMKALHVGWFIAMLIEVHGLHRPFLPALALAAFIMLMIGQCLRYAAILSLKWRWTVKVMTLPGLPPVRSGIYQYLHHPNYLGVVLEIFATPLLHTAYVTAIIFSLLNAVLLSARIRTEEKALRDAVGSSAPVLDPNT